MERNEIESGDVAPDVDTALQRAKQRADRRAKELADLVDASDNKRQALPPTSATGDADLAGIHITGRGYSAPYFTVTTEDEHVRVWIADQRTDESWVQITISAAALAELLTRVIVLRPNYEPELLRVIEVAGRKF